VKQKLVPCVGAIVTDPSGRFLLVRRGNEPDRGRWSVPGGHVEPGESGTEAVGREVLEETGLHVVVGDLVGTVERGLPDGSVLVIRDYRCTPVDGVDLSVVQAADDADDVGWFTAAELRTLDCSPGLTDALESWGVLPSVGAAGPQAGQHPSVQG
jgi:8-oxo-dGTP diphosphatase